MQYASESSAVGSESNTKDTESNAVVTCAGIHVKLF